MKLNSVWIASCALHLTGLQGATAAEVLNHQLGSRPFSGKDLQGWHGMGHFDPRKLWAMSEEIGRQREKDLEDVLKHWSVDEGSWSTMVMGALYDRSGLWKHQLTIDYKGKRKLTAEFTCAATSGSNLGLHQRGRQMEHRCRQGIRWLWNNSQGAPGKPDGAG